MTHVNRKRVVQRVLACALAFTLVLSGISWEPIRADAEQALPVLNGDFETANLAGWETSAVVTIADNHATWKNGTLTF